MPVLGGLPRKLAYVLDLPDSPTGILISSHFPCKPLTELSELWCTKRSVSFWKLLHLICTDVRTETRSGSNRIWKEFLAFVWTRWAVPAASGQCRYHLRNSQYATYANLTFTHSPVFSVNWLSSCCRWRRIQRTVFSDTFWPGPDKNQEVPQRAGFQRPVPV